MAKKIKLDDQLVESLSQNNITELTDLQQICLPKLKSGQDLLCVAANETGKSMAIVIAVLQQLKKPVGDNPRAVIVVPDNDRAVELKLRFETLGNYTDLRVHTACDNEKILDQKDRIYMGADVVIGTIKRLTEIYALYALNLSTVKHFFIDDADEVVKGSNITQTIRLFEGPVKTQHVLFVSQITEWIERLLDESMNVQEIIEFDDSEEDEE